MKPKKKANCDYVVKAVVIGDSGVGKTNILLRYCDGCFKPNYTSTVGVDFKIKTIQVEDLKIKLQIWDTAGQEKFKNISSTFYKGAMIIILAYAIDHAPSFANVENWIKQIHEHTSSEVAMFLVGNKADMRDERKVTAESGRKLAELYDMQFFEVSAKDGTGIEDLFDDIGVQAYERIRQQANQADKKTILLHEEEEDT